MEWKKEYEIGIYEIDQQHKTLVGYINSFKNSLSASTTDTYNEMGKVLVYLINYTYFHFEAEEQLMMQMDYPKLNQHKIIHQNLINKVREVLVKIKQKKSYTPIEFYYFLMSWLNDHILNEDSLLKVYYKKSNMHQDLEKVNLENPMTVLQRVIPNLQLIEVNLEKSFINEEDRDIQRIIFLKDFYSHYSFENKTSYKNIVKSMDLLESNGTISVEEKKSLYNQFKIKNN